MPRAYLRLSPSFYERKLLDQQYPAPAVAALIGCFCLAETQPQRGRFRDRRVLAVLLGSLGRWIPYLVEHGDLIEQEPFPHIYVDGWDEWQEGDWKVAERMHRLRVRTHGVTPVVTVPVTVPVTASRIAEAVSGSGANGGGVVPSRATMMGWKQPDLADIERQHAASLEDAIRKTAEREGKS